MKNKRTRLWLSAVSLGALIGTGALFAQGQANGQADTKGRRHAHYSVADETTVRGTVDELKTAGRRGMHIVLKTPDAKTLELALGPARYQTEKKYQLAKGDQIEVTGAKSTVNGHDVFLVREIKKGSDTMTFRDAKGFPLWAGQGHHERSGAAK